MGRGRQSDSVIKSAYDPQEIYYDTTSYYTIPPPFPKTPFELLSAL